MRIVNQGKNPYIMQGRCKTCKTVVEVDIRSDCKKEVSQCKQEYWCWWETRQRPDYTWWRIVTSYSLPCPVCSEKILVHEEYDDSGEAEAQRKSRRY